MITYCTHRGFNKRMTYIKQCVSVTVNTVLYLYKTRDFNKKKLSSGLKKMQRST